MPFMQEKSAFERIKPIQESVIKVIHSHNLLFNSFIMSKLSQQIKKNMRGLEYSRDKDGNVKIKTDKDDAKVLIELIKTVAGIFLKK